MHRVGGKWYVYFAAAPAERVWDIRIWVLENSHPNPFRGTWVERGQVKTAWETFSLDATTFTHRRHPLPRLGPVRARHGQQHRPVAVRDGGTPGH